MFPTRRRANERKIEEHGPGYRTAPLQADGARRSGTGAAGTAAPPPVPVVALGLGAVAVAVVGAARAAGRRARPGRAGPAPIGDFDYELVCRGDHSAVGPDAIRDIMTRSRASIHCLLAVMLTQRLSDRNPSCFRLSRFQSCPNSYRGGSGCVRPAFRAGRPQHPWECCTHLTWQWRQPWAACGEAIASGISLLCGK
jgi:hypothetical protein